jgi:hypothetical protein
VLSQPVSVIRTDCANAYACAAIQNSVNQVAAEIIVSQNNHDSDLVISDRVIVVRASQTPSHRSTSLRLSPLVIPLA